MTSVLNRDQQTAAIRKRGTEIISAKPYHFFFLIIFF